jgi:hypothetical protein
MASFSPSTAIVRAKFETARETAFGSITSSFTRIGSVFDANFGIVYVQNFTDVVIDFSISFDGLTTTFSLAPSGIICADMLANSMQISVGESAWCKYRSTPPSSGFVQVSTVTPV